MGKLLLITGDLATGKSTFAQILSKRYGTVALFKDKIKELLGDTIGFSNREENLKLSRATMEIMIHSFLEFCEAKEDLILEANFRSSELERLYGIAQDKGYSLLTISLRGDTEILYKRFLNRIENENRHPVHISGFNNYNDFKNYLEAGRKEQLFGRVIEVPANDFSYQENEILLKEIDEFMKAVKTIEILGEDREPTYTKIIEGCRGIITKNGKILLSYEKNVDQYLIPGGGREKGETLEECCKRELAEEAGIIVDPHTHYLTLEEYYHNFFFKSHYFSCDLIGECEQNLTEEEKKRGLEPKWVDFDEALKIFGSYEKYKDINEMRYGAYFREYTALKELD